MDVMNIMDIIMICIAVFQAVICGFCLGGWVFFFGRAIATKRRTTDWRNSINEHSEEIRQYHRLSINDLVNSNAKKVHWQKEGF